MSIVDSVMQMASPLANDNGYRLVDVEYVKEGQNWFLRVYIDKDGGVTLDDCAFFSESLSEHLDGASEQLIPQAYYLEVSSPGAERPLKTPEDMNRAVGEYIYVKLYNMIGTHNAFEGHLVSTTDDTITMTYKDKTREKTVDIERDNIATARIAIQF